MRIRDVTVTLFRWDDIPPTRYHGRSARTVGSSRLGLVTISTDDGVEGHAFLGSAYNPADLDAPILLRVLKPVLIGRDPLDRERLNQELWARVRGSSVRLIGALDVALWDLAGKVAGLPIHRLLGSYRDRVPAYASSQILDSVGAYIEQAQRFRDAGWAAYKIHPPQVWREDIAICEAVREGLGEGFTLMLDACWGYTYEQALRVGRAIETLGFYWYEDPLSDSDLYNYVKLRAKLDIPIMATEYPIAGFDSYAPWIMQRATDFLRGDVAVKGGITTLVKTAHLAEAFGMNFEVHHGGNSLNNIANLHVSMAIRNCEFFEVLLPDEAQKYGLSEDIVVDSDGMVRVNQEPGLGAAIDFDLIASKTEAVLA